MKHLVIGLLLTGGVYAAVRWGWGPAAAGGAGFAGLLAAGIESAAVSLLRPALQPPFERLFKRWAMGLGLRLGGLLVVVVAVLQWPDRFPVVPTAAGFVAVLIPLLLGEMWLVWTNLRTKR